MASTRGADGKYIRSIDQAAKDADAARLRSRAWSYQRIATELGYSDKGAAYRAVQRVLVETVAEAAAELRTVELMRLDQLHEAALDVLERIHYAHSGGKLIELDGVPLRDDGPRLAAIRELRQISESRRKFLGMDAPAKLEVVTLDAVDAAIRDLEAQLARRATAGAPAPTEGAAAAES
jgi:hypothetical protein